MSAVQNKHPERLDRQLLVLAGTLLVGAVAALLDSTIVSVALDAIADDLDASPSALPWVSTAYLLTLALVTPIVAWAVDRFGARRLWLFALAVFLLGSLLCGLAWSPASLIVFRVLKGIGGGMVLPLVQAILAQAAGPSRFGRVMSLVSIPGQLAPIMGPVVGGLIIDSLSWRWIFFVNVPVILLAFALAWKVLPTDEEPRRRRADRLGLLLLPPGVVALVYGFSEIREPADLGDPVTLSALLLGALLVTTFCVHSARSAEPLVDVRLFTSRSFASSAALLFLQGVAVYGALFILPLFYARSMGYGGSLIGWLMAPQGLGMLIGISLAGWLVDRYDQRLLILLSTVVATLGTIGFTQLGSAPGDLFLGGSLCLRGLGLGVMGVAVITAAYRDVPPDRIPRATVMIALSQRVGASFGTAAVALLLAVHLDAAADQPDQVQDPGAYGDTFWWILALVVVMLLPAALMPRRPRPEDVDGPPPRPADGPVDNHRAQRPESQDC